MASFLNDLVRVGFSKVAIIIFGVGTSVATARLLTPEQNGIIATLLVYPSLFMVLGSMGIRQSTTFFVGKEIFNIDRIRQAVTQIWLITSFISMIICFFLFYFLSKNIPDYTLVFESKEHFESHSLENDLFSIEELMKNLPLENLNYYFNLQSVDLTAFLKGTNLTDKLGYVHSSFIKEDAPLPGRAITLGITARF